ncbi:MAG: cation:proton antiporter [Deltaproteobacteria bacterium]|nr:cation:proton antiporter [Deltaproteobacteria bacterium]
MNINFFHLVFFLLTPMSAFASSESHVAPLLPFLIVIFIAAKIGGILFEKIHQPAVLGELIFGVILGNIAFLTGNSIDFFEPMKNEGFLNIISEIGIIILLFQVGLETKLSSMLKVGISSLSVAVVGVAFPFVLGCFLSSFLHWGDTPITNIYVGATLTATSVGITARVLQDLKKIDLNESRIVLGAAVIDDVIGLVILAVVTALAMNISQGFEISLSSVILINTTKAVLFLVGAIFLGRLLAPYILNLTKRLKIEGMSLIMALIFAFALAYMASLIGLHVIVGAFAAGLILEEAHFEGFHHHQNLESIIKPLSHFFVPPFFVLIGMQVSLSVFSNTTVVLMAILLTVVAVFGKVVAGLGAFGKNVDRMSIGIGMIPRGEVGLIFAKLGLDTGIVDQNIYSAVIVMVMATTFITPALLKWSFSRKQSN